ncbi:glycosyltransferase [Gemmatimonas groenlandica]|uniref:Glycosyltransferase n=1 Tax=Gemmatimonas groenlandica TaxID=2732249 RepID=A0A6M4ITN0_9BACT|nr:glycosyltransferase [Gemmatimonas groenlandica]QJR36182.1 glycosyltransferase [Gemmatimonas groenlandica]
MLIFLILVAATAFGILVLGWVIYPSRTAKAANAGAGEIDTSAAGGSESPISVILATRESDEAILRRIDDLRRGDYPTALTEIVIALDATRSNGLDGLREKLPQRTRAVHGAVPGKSSALNAGVAAASHELLFFVDTAQSFEHDTISKLVSAVRTDGWGAMTATLAPTSGDVLMDRYWSRELAIRLGQARRHSIICVTGCAYVMHRRFWRDMPAGLICDDLWSTYSVVTNGGRVGIVTKARVTDPRRFTRDDEYARRLRTMTGMLQFARWFPAVLSRQKNPMWTDFLLHKLTRPATPVLLLVGGAAAWGAIALASPVTAWALLAAGVAIIALVWLLAQFAPGRLGQRAKGLVFAQRLLVMPLYAIARAVRSDWDVWKPHH